MVTDDAGNGSVENLDLGIERKLNLDLEEDRQELIVACAPLAELRRLVEEHLGNYLKWFKAPEWRVVYSGGMMAGPEPAGQHSRMGSSLGRLLQLTSKLEVLQEFAGFERLISGLDNPSQVSATMFEIEVAAWCASRRCHVDLTFSPSVTKFSGIKYPDFLWRTALGDLYCECKQLNMWQRAETRRASTLMSLVAGAMGDPELWPRDVRMEVLIGGRFRGDSQERLKAIVGQQANDARRGILPAQFEGDTFTVTIRDRSEDPLQIPDSVTVYQVQVGPVPVRLNHFQGAHLIVTKSIGLARARALRDFLKEAKRQLPDNGPGGIFVEMPDGIDIATQKLQEMLAQDAHRAVAWASIWNAGGPLRAVWRSGQPFDARLTDPRQGVPAS